MSAAPRAGRDADAECIWGVVPVKAFEAGKTRLTTVLDADARARLARELFEITLAALVGASSTRETLVVTDSPAVAALAEARGARSLVHGTDVGALGRVVDLGLEFAVQQGATLAVVMMGDLPNVTAEDVESVVGALMHADIVVVPDQRGTHTNALGLVLDGRRPTSFGEPHSFAHHLDGATDSGRRSQVVRTRGMEFDIDTPEDFACWQARVHARVEAECG